MKEKYGPWTQQVKSGFQKYYWGSSECRHIVLTDFDFVQTVFIQYLLPLEPTLMCKPHFMH